MNDNFSVCRGISGEEMFVSISLKSNPKKHCSVAAPIALLLSHLWKGLFLDYELNRGGSEMDSMPLMHTSTGKCINKKKFACQSWQGEKVRSQ